MKIYLILMTIIFSFPCFAIDYGIDRLKEDEIIQKLNEKNLAVLTHAAAVDKNGTHLIDILYKSFSLKKIFAPEHGLRSLADDWVEDGIDEMTGLPVISLYKYRSKAPSPDDLKDIDALVVDLQDVGVRYYTYFSTIAKVMEVASLLNIEIILLDRPNLLGDKVEGKVLDENLAGHFISFHTVPTRHGMTLGELAQMINSEKEMKTRLTIVSVRGWNGENLLQNLDRPWIAPSPALVEIKQVGLYALWGILENFNLSVGRGKSNEDAFKVIGAPWITVKESKILAKKLNQLKFPGMSFQAHSWQVTRAIYNEKIARGVRLEWDGSEVRTDEFIFKVTSILYRLFSDRLVFGKLAPHFYGAESMISAIKDRLSWKEYSSTVNSELDLFIKRRQPYLIYKNTTETF